MRTPYRIAISLVFVGSALFAARVAADEHVTSGKYCQERSRHNHERSRQTDAISLTSSFGSIGLIK